MKKVSIIAIIAIIAAVSCTKDFADRNTNKEQATFEMLTYDNLSTGSALKIYLSLLCFATICISLPS